MPRKLREEVVDGIFHVYARGNDRRVIYRDDTDRETYLRLLAATVERCRWRLFAYCLMKNHVHLLIHTPHANLGVGMQRLHSGYALQFNQRHGQSGHVFQGRYGAVRVNTDEQLWGAVVYVVMNPVEAGLCDGPEDWPWGGCSGISPAWVATRESATRRCSRGRTKPGRWWAGLRWRGTRPWIRRAGLVWAPHLVDGRHAEVLVHQDLELRAVGAADVRLVGRPVVGVRLDSLDGAAADLVEGRLAHLRGHVAGEQLLACSVRPDVAAPAGVSVLAESPVGSGRRVAGAS